MLLYESIATGLRRQIAQGTLRGGERLPSVRQLALAHQISPATAVQACLQLEREGLVEARPRSGYFVRAAPSGLPSTPIARRRAPGQVANPALQGLLELPQRPGLLMLHAAVPDASLLPHAPLGAALSRTTRRRATAAMDYAPSQGDPALRRQIAQRYEHTGTAMTAEEIVITAGATEALTLALRVVTAPGDVVLVETPTYYGILQAVAALGLKVLEVPNRLEHGIDVARLDRLLQHTPVRAAILVPNFNNPTGSLTCDADKQALLASCARHGTVVIEDDIYGELAWSGQRPLPLRHWDTGGNVITCGSFSKTLAPGLRVGWLAGAAWTEALARAKYFSSSSNASLPQLAVGDYLARHGLGRHLRRLRRAVADNGQRMRDAIARHWPAGTRCSAPAGGLSLWLQLPPGGDGLALFDAARAAGIGISPGVLFSSRGDYGDCVRLSCGLPWDARLDKAMRHLGRLAARQPGARQ
ncbi:PLP-dependent aminotransferase family protein [Pseudoxanthomonas composti]|uniref:PLP-dependent aminotransferase family protein n=1 Tax=Pseudoxanthomonas composti TaxID=2137479 RepID=A0A4V1N0Q1_9GAMM|nr:PLP-dependent aminotransferase family protein [Pseudoxanthomonas composti]RXR00332.1 PLP-dependent aminotransferase family protein [Pseudoxanthomonas composti]